MPVPADSRRRLQAAVWGGVLLLHALLLAGLSAQRHDARPRGAVPREPAPLMLQWPRWVPPGRSPSPPRGPSPPPSPSPSARARSALPGPGPSAAPAAEAAAPPAPFPAADIQPITPPAPEASTPAAPAALNLTLPRGAQAPWRSGRNPALDDPRANTARARRVEDRIVAALGGDDRITEEHLADGSVRLRRGRSCVIARPNRMQAIDPFNASVSPQPRPIESC